MLHSPWYSPLSLRQRMFPFHSKDALFYSSINSAVRWPMVLWMKMHRLVRPYMPAPLLIVFTGHSPHFVCLLPFSFACHCCCHCFDSNILWHCYTTVPHVIKPFLPSSSNHGWYSLNFETTSPLLTVLVFVWFCLDGSCNWLSCWSLGIESRVQLEKMGKKIVFRWSTVCVTPR